MKKTNEIEILDNRVNRLIKNREKRIKHNELSESRRIDNYFDDLNNRIDRYFRDTNERINKHLK